MSPDPQNITSENNSNRNPQNAEIYNDDSGVSVSGNLSQSDSTSSSGSDGESGTTDFVNGERAIQGNNVQRANDVEVNSEDGAQLNNQNRSDANPAVNMNRQPEEGPVNKELFEIQCKAEHLAEFIISQTLGSNTQPKDEVEATLLRCAKALTNKHKILFNGMMRRIQINEDNAYNAFITVVNELFEGERQILSWGRIVTYYAFGGQLALYCQEKQLLCAQRIPMYVGRYAKEVISNFVHKEGGWVKLCKEFPPEDEFENTVWRVLTWTAIGLGLATAASFLASN